MEPLDKNIIMPWRNEFSTKEAVIQGKYKKIEQVFIEALKSAGTNEVKQREAFDDYLAEVTQLQAMTNRTSSSNERAGSTSPTTIDPKGL